LLSEWATGRGSFRHALVIGGAGCGKTHVLNSVELALDAPPIRFGEPTQDWRAALKMATEASGARVLIDDLDRFDAGFWRAIIPVIRERDHRVLVSLQRFDGRLAKLWQTHLPQSSQLLLSALEARPDDVEVYVRRWLEQQSLGAPPQDILRRHVEVICAMDLEDGFHDLIRTLEDLREFGADFSSALEAPLVLRVQRGRITRRSGVPVILVEGISDAKYLKWAASCLGNVDLKDVEIEACGSAARVPIRAIELRNTGRAAIALFDYDRLGRKFYEDMRNWKLACSILPRDHFPLGAIAEEHIQVVVEIEDLLPSSALARFYAERPERKPELEIRVPQSGQVRLVVHRDDKLELAEWVEAHLDENSAGPMIELYIKLRGELGLRIDSGSGHRLDRISPSP
jgi:hypothetical protein